MSVKIKRNTGLSGTMMNFQVIVNGEKVGTIKNGEVLELDLSEKDANIQFSQLGVKTNEISVAPGDELEVFTRGWTLYALFAVLILSSVLSPIANRYISYGLIVLYFLVAIFVEGFVYQVKKVPTRKVI